MNISKINQLTQEYGCGLGKAKFNLYNGKLGFEYPLVSLGANSFQIDTTLIYSSQYKNTDFNGKKIGFGNGWKLNMQQYLFSYNVNYQIPGFSNEDYLYIDANWNIHQFIKYKSSIEGETLTHEYYDADGANLKLYIKENELAKIIDQYDNEYIFDSDGQMIETISGINKNIIKKITYLNNRITSIYDERKQTRKIKISYALDGSLEKIYTTINNIGFIFKNNENKLVNITKYCNTDSKLVLEIKYNELDKIEYIVNSTDLTALSLEYLLLNNEYGVRTIKDGVMKKNLILEDLKSENYLGDDKYLSENLFVNKKNKKCIGYILSMPNEYVKEEINISYYGNYTQITNDKGISNNYYFDKNGTAISCLEYKNNNIYTLTSTNGLEISEPGQSELKFNGKFVNILDSSNSFTYKVSDSKMESFKNLFRDLNNDGIRDEAYSEHFIISFWANVIGNGEITTNAVLKYTINGKIETKKVLLENVVSGSWQQITIPLNLGLEQLGISSIELLFDGCNINDKVQFTELIVTKGAVPHIVINGKSLEIGTKLCYYSDNELNEVEISPKFYMTESDIFSTYKSMFFNNLKNNQQYDLTYNNGTKIISVDYAGIVCEDSVTLFYINNGKPNYYFEMIDILSEEKYTKTSIDIYFKYDNDTQKYYYENKINVDMMTKKDGNIIKENSLVLYKSQYFNGMFRNEEDENKIKISNIYDAYGNIESIIVSNKDSENENKEELITTYNYNSIDKLRENPTSYKKDGITVDLSYYEDENLLYKIIDGNKITLLNYDKFKENVDYVSIGSNINDGSYETNVIKYNENGKIHSIKNSSGIVYGYKYDIFSNVNSVYRNRSKIFDNNLEKNNDGFIETVKLNKSENESVIFQKCYDNYGRLIKELKDGTEIIYEYENLNGNKPHSLERISKIVDGFSNEDYEISYFDDEISNTRININNKLILDEFADGTLKYNIVNNNENYEYSNEEIKDVKNTTYHLNNQKLEDFSYNYIFDSFGRFSEKKGTETIYNECDDCTNEDGGTCGLIDGVKVDKKINYHKGTFLPEKVSYKITSYAIHENDDVAEFYYQNSIYDNCGNIKKVIESGTRFVENPKNVNYRSKASLPTREYTYTYDSFNRLVGEVNPQFGKLDYIYDDISGMVKEVNKDGANIKTFTYDDGRLININKYGIVKEIKYDYHGNICNNENGTITYNARNLMESYEFNDHAESPSYTHSYRGYYSYNYQGIRYKKKAIEEVTGMSPIIKNISYHLNGSTILGEDWADNNGNINTRIRYFYDAEEICGLRYDGYNFTLIKDSLGNISKVMYKGKIIGEYLYDAWGNCEINEISIANERDRFVLYNNPFRYKGYYYDSESGLYYCQTRYYDPNLCIWLTPDSIEYLTPKVNNGVNLYCYCNNNPVNYKQRPVSSVGSITIPSISSGGFTGNKISVNAVKQIAKTLSSKSSGFNLFGYELRTSAGWDTSPDIATSFFGRIGFSSYVTHTQGQSGMLYAFAGSTSDVMNWFGTTYYAGVGINLFDILGVEAYLETVGIGAQVSIGNFSIGANINLIGGTSITFGWDTDLGNGMTKTDGFTVGVNTGCLVAVIYWIYKFVTTGDPSPVPGLQPA